MNPDIQTVTIEPDLLNTLPALAEGKFYLFDLSEASAYLADPGAFHSPEDRQTAACGLASAGGEGLFFNLVTPDQAITLCASAIEALLSISESEWSELDIVDRAGAIASIHESVAKLIVACKDHGSMTHSDRSIEILRAFIQVADRREH